MSRAKIIAVRLDQAELTALRRVPGAGDSERVRNLIMNSGIADSTADKIAGAVRQENTRLLVGIDKHLSAGEGRVIAANKLLIGRLVDEMNKPFTQILDYMSGKKR